MVFFPFPTEIQDCLSSFFLCTQRRVPVLESLIRVRWGVMVVMLDVRPLKSTFLKRQWSIMWKAKYGKRNCWCSYFANVRQVSVSGQWAPYNVGLRRRIPLTHLIQLWLLSSSSYIGPVRVVQYHGQLPNLRSDHCSFEYLRRRSTSKHNIVVVILLTFLVQVFINRLLVSFKIRTRSAMNSLVAVFLFTHSNISLGSSIYFLLPR